MRKRIVLSAAVLFAAIMLSLPVRVTGQDVGIKVHGRWTIDVLNPDGTLAQHREFNNALRASGAWALGNAISGNLTIGRFGVALTSNTGAPCVWDGSPVQFHSCRIVETTSGTPPNPELFKTLTRTLVESDLILTGSATANRDGDIEFVATEISSCGAEVAPSHCLADSLSMTFTETRIEPLHISSGQIVQVKVTVTFS